MKDTRDKMDRLRELMGMKTREDNTEDRTIYVVIINREEQYSIWPSSRELPLGWNDAGFRGTKQECLNHIEQVWTDMRPLSVRKSLDERNRGQDNQ